MLSFLGSNFAPLPLYQPANLTVSRIPCSIRCPKPMQTESETEDFLQRPLADIIDEVKRLRAEKNSLVASNNALRHNISALRHNISSLRLLPDLYASQLLETKSFLRTMVRSYLF